MRDFTGKLPALLCLFCLLSFAPRLLADMPALTGALWQTGTLTQGGLILAQIPNGASAQLDNQSLAISPSGYLAFGFHRDDQKAQMLTITLPDGTEQTSRLIPKQRRYKTQSITGLAKKYVSPPQEVLDRIARDAAAVKIARAAKSTTDDFIINGLDWPVSGQITGIYGSQRILNGKPRAPHYGIDIAAPRGTIITAPADGTITLADDLYYTGGTIIVDHGLSVSSTFLHLERMDVTIGARVTRGQRLGTVGSTGRSTGPHLDWRLNWGQKRLDPQLAVTSAMK